MTKQLKRLSIVGIVGLLLLVTIVLYEGWRYFWAPNVMVKEDKAYLYIPTGSTFSDVCHILESEKYLHNLRTFRWVAEKKGYPRLVKAGRYRLRNGMSNNELVNMLRAGKQEPVTLVLRKFRTLPQVAGFLGKKLEPDSVKFIQLFNSSDKLSKYNLQPQTLISIFIPNTYYIFWNTPEDKVVERMYEEFQRFWDSTRMAKARLLKLTPVEVITLASIVEEETNAEDEYSIIAGVYINRLKRGMPLQADPTVRFAIGDFQIKRVLLKHLTYSSPYNTYLHRGLPPGPICTPSVPAIDGVLNYASHHYLYFCARADFSGRHVFAQTLSEHNKNARAYQQALRIWLRKQSNGGN